jgi:AraC family transcriptional regulator
MAREQHAFHQIGRLAHEQPERVIGGASPLAVVWSHGPMEATVDGLPQHAIALHLDGCTLVEMWSGSHLVGHISRVGSVSLVPARRRTRWVLGGHSRVAHLYVDPDALEAVGSELGLPSTSVNTFFGEMDPTLAGLVREALRMDASVDPLARGELMARTHRHLLLRHGSDAAHAPSLRATALTAATLRRVYRHLDERWADRLSLAELASIARLSEDHFLRAFKAAVGQTPHQLVIARRVAESQRLLHGTTLPLSEIASRCGFASASHFAAVFRSRLGMTPSAWRSGRSALVPRHQPL